MFLGMVQFYYAQPLFGDIGSKPKNESIDLIDTLVDNTESITDRVSEKLNKFLTVDYILIGIFIASALIFIINDPLSKIGNINTLNFTIAGMSDSLFFALVAAIVFILILVVRIPRYEKIVRDRMIAFTIFCIFTIFFWAAFEQAAGSYHYILETLLIEF